MSSTSGDYPDDDTKLILGLSGGPHERKDSESPTRVATDLSAVGAAMLWLCLIRPACTFNPAAAQ